MSQPTPSRGTTDTAARPAVLNNADRIGVGVLVLIFLGGLWLMAAPFIVGYQQRSSHWSHGTISSFTVGAGVSVLALATLVVFVAGLAAEMTRLARQLQRSEDGSSVAESQPTDRAER